MILPKKSLPPNDSYPEEKRKKLLISVIVATLNAEDTLQQCIDSIARQTYSGKELIIIDGGSTDGTEGILKRNEADIAYWESEPDKGIYHAWNKAVRIARGDYICFLGADDYWQSANSLERLAEVSAERGFPELVSGKVGVVDSDGNITRQIGKEWNSSKMKRWMIVAHPGTLHHKHLFEQYGMFSEDFKIAGDYEFLLRFGEKTRHAFIDEIMVCIGAGGQSRISIKEVFHETYIIQSQHNEIGVKKAIINYLIAYVRYIIRQLLNKV